MANLYRLTSEAMDLRDKVMRSIDYDTGEVDFGLTEALTAKTGEVENKIIACGQVRRSLLAQITEAKAEINRLTEIKKKLEKAVESIENGVSTACQRLDIKRIDSIDCNVSFRKSEAVEIYNVVALPDEFVRVKVVQEPDLDRIKKALKAGEQVDGARLVDRQNIQFK